MSSTVQSAPSPDQRPGAIPWYASGFAVVAFIVALRLLLHLLTANRYGFHPDELYYMAEGEHLDWGYVDAPPLVASIAWFSRTVFGPSQLAIRFLPALAAAGLVALTGYQAHQFGGKRYAMGLSALGIACAGVFVIYGHLLTYNVFEPLVWMGCATIVIHIIQTGNQKLWVWFGLLAGIGLELKYTVAVFGFGVVVGLLLTPERRAFAHKWIWIAGIVAFLVFLPNLIWNINSHWPIIELQHNIKFSSHGYEVPLSLPRLVVMLHPVTLPLWLMGLGWLFFGSEGRRYRVLGWSFLTVLTVLVVAHGKDYYAAPAFPMLFAAGGVACEQWIARSGRRWLKPAFVFFLLLSSIPLLPLYAPVLSADRLLQYFRMLHYFPPPVAEHTDLGSTLPQHVPQRTPVGRVWYRYWNEMGWEPMVAEVARVYHSLPLDVQRKTAIMGHNYGECGAVDFYGPKYGLPKSICTHLNYWYWGPREYTGESMIIIGDPSRWLLPSSKFDHVEKVGHFASRYALEAFDIYYAQGLKWKLAELWPELKQWI